MSALNNNAVQTQNTLYGPVNFDYNEFLRYYKDPQNYTALLCATRPPPAARRPPPDKIEFLFRITQSRINSHNPE
jgi:hypothetical protein